MRSSRRDLLRRAAECFLRDGVPDEAVDCYVAAGDHLRAAELLRDLGRPLDAARQYQQLRQWRAAADCLYAAGHVREAVDSWVAAGDVLLAAWELVLSAAPRRPPAAARDRARQLAASVTERSAGVRQRRRLVLSLCEPDSTAARRATAVVLTEAPAWIADLPQGDWAELERWAVRAATFIERPDLAAGVFAASYRAGGAGVLPRWRQWTVSALGDATGVPER
ncbi:hypothetical protein ACQP2E_20860 [Actinoplanes sp. CA-015351]|uniref:hypothetical protein n=1 Tax=Actinoplanes sp. CA-015351 TaxID=3239897 RepID=UPI003D9838DB